MTDISSIQLKTLLLSVITEIKHGFPLDSSHGNSIRLKKEIKKARNLPINTSNEAFLKELGIIYGENGLLHEYNRTVAKFGLKQHMLIQVR